MSLKDHYQVVIVGGGTAGITVASQLAKKDVNAEIAIIEPSDKHYYQPLWTLVGGGVFPKETTQRDEIDFIPDGVTWIREAVSDFHPEENEVITLEGNRFEYDHLVIAAGIQLDWNGIKGLEGNVGKYGICSNYSYDTVDSTWEYIRNFKGGKAIFTHPSTPIKCGGAPQKICYLADDYFRKKGLTQETEVIFATANSDIFPVKRYADNLKKVIARKGINAKYQHDLIEIRPEEREAVFKKLATGEEVVLDYDMIHVTPPMSAPDFIKESPLTDDAGWVDVDKDTLIHNEFSNIYGIGDVTNLPTSKTGAAVHKQAPVLVENLVSRIKGQNPVSKYDGYTSCPLVTGYGKLILAEFDYDKTPRETFPFDQSRERYSMYLLKAYVLPQMYWHGMLKGRF